MNLELIIKLTKLANKNPNDNEANSAARKVCKLIEEGNFQFNEDKIIDKTISTNIDFNSTDAYKDLMNIMKDIHSGKKTGWTW